MRTTFLAVVLVVGLARWGEAGPILTYTFTTDSGPPNVLVSGSFQVDSSHIATSGNTDMSGFITNASFTAGGFIFDSTSIMAETVTVTPAGDLTRGSGPSSFTGHTNNPSLGGCRSSCEYYRHG